MDLAYAAGRAGGTMTGVLSAANEKAVEMFIDEKYVFLSMLYWHPNLRSRIVGLPTFYFTGTFLQEFPE